MSTPSPDEPSAAAPAGAGGFFALSIDRPVATTMIVIALCVFGALSYGRLGVALMPELSYPTLTVRTGYPGAAPEEVERDVTKPIEETLRTVSGLASITSASRAGTSDVVLEFRWGTSMADASQGVRERLDVLNLPDEVERPLVLRYDPELDPIVRLGLHGDIPLTDLRRLADEELKRALVKVAGVAMVRVSGGLEPVVRIELDRAALAQRGLDANQVVERLRQENVDLAGGRLDDGSIEYLVRTLGAFVHIGELRRLIIGVQGGVPVRLEGVATVEMGARDQEVVTRIGGRESVEIAVFKEADANLVEVAERVILLTRGAAEAAKTPPDGDEPAPKGKQGRGARAERSLASDLPPGVHIEVLSDRSVFIRSAVGEVVDTAVLGGILAVVVLLLFLRSFYATFIIGLAIPLSLVLTFAAMYLGGITLNVMSLGGLALGVGMLVDNAVVVLESVYRCREEGDAPRTAALRGVREVGGAVVASTLTTIAVFFPIVFVEGIAGQVFGDLALAVVFSLLASLAVALFFVPMLAARAERPRVARRTEGDDAKPRARRLASLQMARDLWRDSRAQLREASWPVRVVLGAWLLLVSPYRLVRTVVALLVEVVVVLGVGGLLFGAVRLVGLLARAVAVAAVLVMRPFWAVFGAGFDLVRVGYLRLLAASLRHRATVVIVASALTMGAWWVVDELGTELIPAVHQGELLLDVTLPVDTGLDDTSARVRDLATLIDDMDGVARTSSIIGARADDGAAEGGGRPNTARITVLLTAAKDLAAQEDRVLAALRQALERQAGLSWEVQRPALFSLKQPVELHLRADDLGTLRKANRVVMDALRDASWLHDLRTSLTPGYPEVVVRLERDALQLRNLDGRQVAEAVRQAVHGATPTAFRSGESRLDIVVRLDRKDVTNRSDLSRLIVRPRGAGPPVELSAVASISEPQEGPSEIRHVEGQRVVVIDASPAGIDLSEAVSRLEATVAALALPASVQPRIAGQGLEMIEASASLSWALLLAIFLVYVVMAARFESLAGPLVIMLTIPLAGIGVVAALWWTKTPISVVVFIGVIMLAGIVVNNAIVLVDYIMQLQRRGIPRIEAIQTACEVRLRPVLITTLTTILGLLPLALGLGEGAELRAPMALAVMAGLGSSTLLTLLVVPVVYTLITRKQLGRYGAVL